MVDPTTPFPADQGPNDFTNLSAPPPATGNHGLAPNIAAALAYLCTLITGLIVLMLEKENREVRFHAWQSIFFGIGAFVIAIVIGILTAIFSGFLIFLGGVIAFLGLLIKLGLFVLWIVCMVKAYKGEHFKLPIVGDLAEAQVAK